MKSPIGRRWKDELAHLLDCLLCDGPLLPVAGGLRGDLPMSINSTDPDEGHDWAESLLEACERLQQSDNPTARKLGDYLPQALSDDDNEEARS